MHKLLTPCAKISAKSSSQKPGSEELDAKKASYFDENGIAFNTAASSSFALMIEESMKFARINQLQNYRYLIDSNFWWNSLTMHMTRMT